MNRFLILVLLLGVLYALYKYQQQISDIFVGEQASKKQIGKKRVDNKKLIDVDSMDDISLDHISQFSLGSLEDVNSKDGYKQDSMMESLDSGGTLSLLGDDSLASNESFFFQQTT